MYYPLQEVREKSMATQNHVRTTETSIVRHGEEGGCIACEHPIRAHFGPKGQWVGCPNADQDTTFILVPVRTLQSPTPVVERRQGIERRNGHDGNGNGNHLLRRMVQPSSEPNPGRRQEDPAPAPIRTLRAHVTRPRFVYHCADRRTRPALTPVRGKVYDALKASPKGLVYSDIRKKTKLVHGSVQQTLNWLRNHKYVVAEVPKS